MCHVWASLVCNRNEKSNDSRDVSVTAAGKHSNLTLASEQDSDRYDSKQQSTSAGGSFTFGSMTGSASVNASRDRMHSTWQSVEEQTGIFAGKGGFDVSVGKHTQLDGAVIGSTAAADKNRLETGTLGWNDIENHADYKVEHQSAGISTGGSIAGQFAGNMANGLLVGANHGGSDSSTTKAAVSEGASKEDWAAYNKALAVTDSYKAAQQQWRIGSAIQQRFPDENSLTILLGH